MDACHWIKPGQVAGHPIQLHPTMSPNRSAQYYQDKLPFPKKSLWERLPEANRDRCRKALIQLLQQVVLETDTGHQSHNSYE
jgi:hypothetical protein